jgi:hypothetical protein
VGTSRWSNSSGRKGLHGAHAIDVGPNEQDAQPLLAVALMAWGWLRDTDASRRCVIYRVLPPSR